MMDRLATNRGRNDDEPNIELAVDIARRGDAAAVAELVGGMSGKDAAIASDCVKALYETGYREPRLLAGHAPAFVTALRSRNNRLVWGGMIALGTLAPVSPDEVYAGIDVILRSFERGSVITVDAGVRVLAGLSAANGEYARRLVPVLLSHLETCRPKDVAQHAESAAVCMTGERAAAFARVLEARRSDLTPAQAKRVDKVLGAGNAARRRAP